MDYGKYAEQFIESVSLMHTTRNLDSISRFTRGETKLLEILRRNGGRMQAKELARNSGITTARVTAILNVEEEKGYIRREAITGDRRKINVILTEEGELEYRRRYRRLQDMITAYFTFLGETETMHLLRIMNLTREFMESRRKENQGE